MPKRRIDVFVSSTIDDLEDYRDAVRDEILTFRECRPVMKEDWPAEEINAVDKCMNEVDGAEIYIGIYAHRYGFIPKSSKISITEMEFNRAGERGIPRLCFLIDPGHPWNPKFIEGTRGKTKLDKFKKYVESNLMRAMFTTPESLAREVGRALREVVPKLLPTFPCDRVPKPALFAGRVNELAELKKALEGDQAVAITAVRGVGGIGKTTLAQQVAHEVGDKFGLKLWASLGQNFEESRVGDVLRDWAGEKYPLDWPLDRIIIETKNALTAAVGECGDGVLIVIDDVWKESVGSARKLLKAVPDGARILITTRTEAVAAQMDARTQRLQHMPPNEGADLLLKHLENTDAAKYREKLEVLSEVLGGHPLALKLAARQLRLNFTPRDLDDMIASMKKGLAAGEAFKNLELDGGDEKEDSVSVTLQQTLDRLGGDDVEKRTLRQKQFRALGALPPDIPFRAEYVAAVWSEEDRRGLRELVGEGLLEQAETASEGEWYSQHRLLRAYARGLAREQNELDMAGGRYSDAVIETSEQFDKLPADQWGKLEGDLPHLIEVGDTLVEMYRQVPDYAELQLRGLNFASNLIGFLHLRREVQRLEWLEMGLKISKRRGKQKHESAFLNAMASYYAAVGEKYRALEILEQALSIDRILGDQSSEATALNNIGEFWSGLGEHEKALDYFKQSLFLHNTIDKQRSKAILLSNIGLANRRLGEHQTAFEYYMQALPLHQAEKDRTGEARTLSNIGIVLFALDEKVQALKQFEKALPIHQAVGDRLGEATTLSNIGLIYFHSDRIEEALEIQRQIITIYQIIRSPSSEALTRFNFAAVLYRLNRIEEAIEQVRESSAIFRKYNLPEDSGGGTLAENEVFLKMLEEKNASK